MPRVTQHLRVGTTLVCMLVLAALPLQALAAAAPSFSVSAVPEVVITEMQTAAGSASQEFIELYNLTGSDIDFADVARGGKEAWKLQFFSAAGTSSGTPDWTKPSATISLTGTIPAGGYYLVSSTGYAPGGIDSDQAYSPRLSGDGGGLQVVTSSGTATTVSDRLMWKQNADGKPLAAGQWPAPAANSSLQRLPKEDDTYVSADGSLTGFISAEEISPKDIWRPVVVEELLPATPETPSIPPEDGAKVDGDNPAATPPPLPETVQNGPDLMPPAITELLPNPASPLKDETDEFIELYNPNEVAFNLKGYTLQVGTSTLHDFTFSEDYMLPAQSYTALYSRDTRLSLTNTGSQARLLSPAGAVLQESSAYTSAAESVSWVYSDSTWQWSTTSTPGLANVVTAPPAKVPPVTAAASTTQKTTAKKPAVRTASAKVKGVSTTRVKKATTLKTKNPKKSAKPKIATVAQTTQKPDRVPIHNGILVAVAASAVLYAAYEYRSDISNRFYKLRHHRAIRGLARK